MEISFLPTNTSEIHLHVEQLLQNTHRMRQKTSDFPKGRKLPTYLRRAKEKKEKTEKKE